MENELEGPGLSLVSVNPYFLHPTSLRIRLK